MADSVTLYYGGNQALASYVLLLDGDGVEIASTGEYLNGTGITLTGVDYTDNILQIDDIAVDLVSAEIGYVDVYDSADEKLIRFTLDPVLTLDNVEYTFVWPVGGIEFASAPTVTTGVTTLITANSATCAGNVTDDGNGTISERGIAYGTSINPTIAGDHESVSGTTGEFTAGLTGLVELTTYHYRAFATNEVGTSYGDDVTFITTHATIPCVLGSILIPSYAHIYDQTGSYSFPWDWMRSKSRYSRLNGLGWQFNTSYADNNLAIRVRETLGNNNLVGQYCTPSKIYDPAKTDSNLRAPYANEVATKFVGILDDEILSPYQHVTDYTEVNRRILLGDAQTWWARFGQTNWLEYVFGLADGSGKQPNNDDCWVVATHLATDHKVRIFCNDNIIKAYTPAALEALYANNTAWMARYDEYLYAYQNRIIKPRGLKLAGNIGLDNDSIAYYGNTLGHLDIYYNEYMFCRPISSSASAMYTWSSGYYRLYNQIEMLKYMLDRDKGILLGQDWFLFPAWFTCAAGTGALKVYSTASGRALAVKHSSIDAGAYTDYLLADYSTINALIAAVNSKFSGAITISQNMDPYGCDYLVGYDSPHKLATMAEATFTTTGTYLKAMEPARYAWLTSLCLGILAGAGAESELYLGINPNSASNWQNARERITDLINIPLGYPDPEMTDYERYPGETVTNIYYRKLLTVTDDLQAIAVLNWESSAKTVSASDFDLEYFIDPFTTYFTTNPVTVTPVATISLPKFSGTVLLTGA